MHGDVNVMTSTDTTTVFKFKKGMYLVIKRTFDIICALLGVILMLPAAFIIKIVYMFNKDFQSIFFTQDRIGKNGKTFKFYKFRTMVPNADEVLQHTLELDPKLMEEYSINKKLKNDPRITKVGKFIRKTSLDELPQFINILLGHMSLIGNRPYLPREKKDMGKSYDEIIKTKPGLTGYWQVSGRSNTTFKERLKLETYYSNHAGFKLDIKVFFKTFEVVLFGKGAE